MCDGARQLQIAELYIKWMEDNAYKWCKYVNGWPNADFIMVVMGVCSFVDRLRRAIIITIKHCNFVQSGEALACANSV